MTQRSLVRYKSMSRSTGEWRQLVKKILLTTLALGAATLSQAQTTPPAAAPIIHVQLLGTGVPSLNAAGYNASGRVNSGLLITAGTERMLFDCGQGIITRLFQSNSADVANDPNVGVDKVFITHLHSDHLIDLPSLYIYGWLFRDTLPLRVWGPGAGPNQPVGMYTIMNLARVMYDTDIYARSTLFKDIVFSTAGVAPVVTEVKEGVVYSKNGVTVTAFLVDHHPIEPAFGYRVDYQGHSVVFSGDTQYTDNLVKYSAGADVIIHEAWGWNYEAGGPELWNFHTNPEDLARIFRADQPKLAVMTHIGLAPIPAWGSTTTDDLVKRIRTAGYNGGLVAGLDLMQIDVMAQGVNVTQPPAAKAISSDDEATNNIPLEVAQRLRALAKQQQQ